MSWLSYLHLVAPPDAAAIGWYHTLWAVFVLALVGTSFARSYWRYWPEKIGG